MTVLVIAVLFLFTIVLVCRCRSIPKLQGVYSHGARSFGHYVKSSILSLILWFVKTRRRIKRSKNTKQELGAISFKSSSGFNTSIAFTANDKQGNFLHTQIRRLPSGESAEVTLIVRLSDGSILTFDDTTVASLDCADNEDYGSQLSAGGLRIQTVTTARVYRLMYSGLMRRGFKDGSHQGDFVEVNIRMWFKHLNDPTSFSVDYSPSMIADSIASECHPVQQLKRFLTSKNRHFEQCGQLKGTVEFDQRKEQLTLNGIRNYSVVVHPEKTNGFFTLRARFARGLVFSLTTQSTDSLTHQSTGFVAYQNGFVYPVDWTDFHLSRIAPGNDIPNNFKITVQAHGRFSVIDVELLPGRIAHKVDSTCNKKWLVLNESIIKVTLNGDEIGYGMIQFNDRGKRASESGQNETSHQIVNLPSPPAAPLSIPFCTQLTDPICRLPSITGGKASKLSDITVALANNKHQDLYVPNGFTVTVAAYQKHVDENPTISEAIINVLSSSQRLNEHADEASKDVPTKALENACDKLQEILMGTPISKALVTELEANMKKSFGKDWQDIYTAVRSSAIGEDGSEASGAGQMETFLGIKGIEKVVKAIKKCWSSNYSFRAVQYRRQLCTNLDPPMAVVVQQLVDAEIAGVLFTRDPDNGSTARMVINASYGIGEGVVSGEVDPDTVSIHKVNPEDPKSIKINYDVIGDKSMAFTLDKEHGTVHQRPITKKQGCCLTEAEIFRLYEIGSYIEGVFSSARDIEFAMKRNETGRSQIYILQARPITTADMEEEWELLQEFNTPIASDEEVITTANIQEMMPGALSPLSARLWMEGIAGCTQGLSSNLWLTPPRRYKNMRPTPTYYQHIFLNYTLISMSVSNERMKHTVDMAFFGRPVPEVTLESIARQNDMTPGWQRLLNCLSLLGYILPKKGMQEMIERVEAVQIKPSDDPKEIMKDLRDLMPIIHASWVLHVYNTQDSSKFNSVMMRTLDPEGTWSPDIHADVALMLADCENVYSVDVPLALERIAQAIKETPESNERFQKMDRFEGAKWLLSVESGLGGELFRAFLAKHGHRCVRESDIREKSWNDEPEKVVDSIKLIITRESRNCATKGEALTVEDALDSIKTAISPLQRLKLRYFLKKARKAVGLRECSKSFGIKTFDFLRQEVALLGKALTKKGYLPDVDLVYFLELEEIEVLLEKRSPKLIARALRRRKLFPKLQAMRFSEMGVGNVEPVEEVVEQGLRNGEFTIKGTAIGHHCVSGVARVVRSLAEANQIKNGEILIVPFTDIGWSPYFPMVSGLVTELGGLISHGAVVAREYGLPCLVGCKQATHLIKTGDIVCIDGQASLIKVTPAEE